MSVDTEAPEAGPAAEGASSDAAKRRAPIEARIAAVLMTLLPGVLIVYFGFNGGGYFPGAVGFVGLVVLQMLTVRVLLADEPFAGVSRPLAVVGGAMVLFSAWVLASGLWSDATDRALKEFNRDLFYTALLVVLGTLPRARWKPAWFVRACAAGATVVCVSGLITRILPHVWHTTEKVANNRLSFPVTYWNALGLLAALGILLCLGLTSSDREPRAGRLLSAMALPPLAATLLFTFSRGAILAVAVGIVLFVVLARQRRLPGALLAVVAPVVVAVIVSYQADQLATANPTTSTAVSQGKHVAIVLLLCVLGAGLLRLLAELLDRRVARLDIARSTRRRIGIGLGSATALVLVVALVAGGASWLGREYDRFAKGATISSAGDLRSRLSDPSANGRTKHWAVALEGFSAEALHGHGAGTFEFEWAKRRKEPGTVIDAHSLYVEVLDELGIIGLIPLLVAIGGILYAFLARARGPNRGYWIAFFSAGIVWALSAGIDWHWEMPVVTAWFFAVGGAALASPPARGEKRPAPPGRTVRIAIAAALLVSGVAPWLMLQSQSRLERSATAFDAGDCTGATRYAIASIQSLAVRPEPYQIVGYCNLDDGRAHAAVAAMQKAVEQEPSSWEYRFSLAVAEAEAGLDPRPELRRAAALNPLEDLVKQAEVALRGNSPDGWARGGAKIRVAAESSGRLTLK